MPAVDRCGAGRAQRGVQLGLGRLAARLPGTAPIDAFIPALTFSVLFGLSTDYEVFLLSRMRRQRRGDAPPRRDRDRAGQERSDHRRRGVHHGVGFGSFLLSGERILQELGFGLGFAVFVDVLVMRSILVPAIMHSIGPPNWGLPTWLDHVLPSLSIEAEAATEGRA